MRDVAGAPDATPRSPIDRSTPELVRHSHARLAAAPWGKDSIMTKIQLVSLLCLTGAAAIVDARTRRIPNRLLAVALLGAVIVRIGLALAALEAPTHRAVAAASLEAIGGAALGMIGCALLPLILYRVGAMGGGDVKLLGVAGALVALGPGLELTRAAFIAAAVFGVAQLVRSGRLSTSLQAMPALMKRLVGMRVEAPPKASSLTSMPFGPHVFIAACYLALTSWTPASEAPSSDGERSSSGALTTEH
jgi:prepilin peptidase CpaA